MYLFLLHVSLHVSFSNDVSFLNFCLFCDKYKKYVYLPLYCLQFINDWLYIINLSAKQEILV